MTENAVALPVPAGETPDASRRRWWVLILVCFAQFMVALDATIVNVALPTIEGALGMSQEGLQWIVNGYALAFGGFLLLGGRMADLIGRKRLFVAGVSVFTLASLVCGLSDSETMLIVARIVQGVGAALVSPAALSIVTTTFAEGTDRTRALGVWSAVAAGGGAFGLLLGGMLTEWLTWRWVFFVNVPIGVVVVLVGLRLLRESRQVNAVRHFDFRGAVTVTGALSLLVFGISKAQSWGWGSPSTIGVILGALALLGVFALLESRSPNPLVRLRIFRVRSLASSNLVLLLVVGGLVGMFFLNTLYLQGILGYSPLEAGIAFVPVTLAVMAAAGVSSQLVARFGVRPLLVLGLGVAAVGLALFTRVPVDGSYWVDVLPASMLLALGMGTAFVPITLSATANVGAEDAGLASGILNTSQQIGGALGVAILATAAASRTASLGGVGPEAIVAGYHVAYLIGAILVGAGAILAFVLLRGVRIQTADAPAPAAS